MHFADEEDKGRKELFAKADELIKHHSGNKSRPFSVDHNDFSQMVLLFLHRFKLC